MAQLVILHVVILLVFVNGSDCDIATQKRTRTIERFRRYIQGLNISALPDNIQNRLKDLGNVPLNVAVTGESGVGKSSLINTLRNLAADDLAAAPVGVVEMTTKRRNYTDPEKTQHVYWDLPGCDTPAFPRETYLDRVGFDEYDFFLIVSVTRFKEIDAWLAQEITKRKKEFFFVRNKIDIDVYNEKRDHPTRNESEILDEIRRNCMQHLHMITKLQRRIYLISSVLSEKSKWDFTRLVEDSIQETLRLKQELLINQLTSFSRNEIMKRTKELRLEIIWYSARAALFDLIPVFGISLVHQMHLIEQQTATYKMKLLLDEKWLLSLITSEPPHFEMISSRFFGLNNIPYYIRQLTCYIVLYISKTFLEHMSGNREVMTTSSVWKKILAPSWAIFRLICVFITFFMTYYRLSSLIGGLEDSALYLIDHFA